MRRAGRLRHAAVAALLAVGLAAAAAPFVPTSDAQVLERLPARASDPRARELNALRQALRQAPGDLGVALRLAQGYFDAVAAEGDPRYIGYAQSALQPWWTLPDPPAGVRVLRAMLLQFDHRFEPALADLDAALQADPGQAQAWAWRAAITLVRADYGQARRSCEGLAPLVPPLVATACRAQVDAATGRAGAAAAALRGALQAGDDVSPEQRLWVLTRLAETEERRGDWPAAEAAFRQALALGLSDVYLLAAYADFLLDRGRPAEVLALLKDRGRADVLLLRQALAARATGAADAAALARELAARFDAARLRGDTTHRKEESRFLLALGPPGPANLAQALALASANFAEQREPADARILLEAAVAARDPAAAAPALKWRADAGIESPVLAALAEQLKAGR
jgi:hypothetical protein